MRSLVLSVCTLYGSVSGQGVGVPLVPPGGAVLDQPLPVTKIPPPGQLFGAFGQLCPAPAPTAPTTCSKATDVATDAGTGMLLCEAPYDCCLCESITCGTVDIPCQELSIGTAGAFGVKSINVVGTPTNGGAGIECGGADACKHAKMTGSAVSAVDCGSPDSCKDSIISLTDPAPYFALECSASGSCEGAFVGLNYPAPAVGVSCPAGKKEVIHMGGIQCSTAGSCTDLTFGVANSGCSKIVIDIIECLAPGACTGATFNFIGDIDVLRCELGTTGQTGVTGLEKCFTTTTLAPATTAPPATTVPATPQTTTPPVVGTLVPGGNPSATTAAPGSVSPQTTAAASPGTTSNMVWMVNSNLGALNCQDAYQCAGGVATVTNPSNFLVFQCSGRDSCNNADLTISLTTDAISPITNIDSIILRGDGSGAGMTINIDNQQGLDQYGNPIITSLDRILCEGRRSCVDTTFMVGYNTAVGSIVCARGACRGCTVQIDASSQAFPCDPNPQPTTLPPTMAQTTVPPAPVTTVPATPVTTTPGAVATVVPGGLPSATTAAPVTPATTAAVPATTAAPVTPATTAAVPAPATTVPAVLTPRTETFTNMPTGWSFECAAANSCENGMYEIHLDGASTNPIRRYDGFVFTGENSGRGATVSVHNKQVSQRGNVILTVDEIACEGASSCVGATFVVGYNVAIQSIVCAPGACFGCTIKVDATSPPFPCDSTQVTTAPPATAATTTAAPVMTTVPPVVVVPGTTAAPVVPAPVTTSPPVVVATTSAPAPATTASAPGPVSPGLPRVETYTNEGNGWFLNCNRDSSCKEGSFTVNIDNTVAAPVTQYDGFLFTGPYSGFGATITINNQQSNTVLNVGQLACRGDNACDGLTFIIGYNVAVQRVICAAGACDRCFVQITANGEQFPCDPSANNAPITTAPPVLITTAAPPSGLTTAAPMTTVPAVPVPPVDPVFTTSAPAQVPLVGVSDLTCSTRGECQGVIQKVVNPINNFYIFCGDAACSGAQFTIDLNSNAAEPITRLDGYLFEGESAAAGAVVTVNNQQSGRTVANIAKIQCRGLNACAGTTFYTGYFVSIGGVECTSGACPGCTIDIAGTVYPCDPSQSASVPVPAPVPGPVPAPGMTTAAPLVPTPTAPVAMAPAPVTMSGSRDLSCHHGANSCQNGVYTVTNPANGFLLYCGAASSCQSASFTLDLLDGTTNRINGLMFQEVASAAGATITVNNANPFVVVEIERISCGASDACTGTTIDVGYGVAVSRLDCEPGACMGCTVVVGGTHYPCDPLQV